MKKLPRRADRFKGYTIGLDLHQAFIQYSLWDEQGEEQENERIKADKTGLSGLVDRVVRLAGERGLKVQVALEASGCFVWAYDLLKGKLGGERVKVAAPSKVRVIAESGEKNDENDSWWLGYLAYEGRLPRAFVAEGDLRELRIASRERQSVVEAGSELKRRLRSHLAQLGEKLGKSVWHSQKGEQETQRLVEQMKNQEGERGLAIGRLWKRIQDLQEEEVFWAQRVQELAGKFKEVALIREETPGLGVLLSGVVWSELGDPGRYKTAKAYAKATGLTPSYRESGGKKFGGGITRMGNARVRWALTRGVVACLRCKEGPGVAVRQWVEKMCRRKSKKAAIVAAARKLAEGIWRLFSYGEAFDAGRAFGVRAQAQG
jgi:transposase